MSGAYAGQEDNRTLLTRETKFSGANGGIRKII